MQPIRLIAMDMDGTLLKGTSPTSAVIRPQWMWKLMSDSRVSPPAVTPSSKH